MSSGVREPVAAGSLYAADPQQLRVEIDAAINQAQTEFAGPKLLVLPDCGVVAAPQVAGSSMLMLESERDHIDRVVLVADHEATFGDRAFAGIAVPRSIAFRTPLGDLLVDRDAVEQLSTHPSVVLNDKPFVRNESLEVHLPPIQRLLGGVKILPMLVGDATPAQVVDVVERVWGGRNTLVVVSSTFARGQEPDRVTEEGERVRSALGRSDAAGLRSSASSPISLSALAAITSRRSMGLNELASDTIEDPFESGHYVDAAAFGAWESVDVSLAGADVVHLRALALSAVHLTVLGGRVEGTDTGRVPPALAARRACVVTLRRDGQTRGSAGTIEADRPLAASVVRNASAACADPRLPSIQPSELDSLDMAISVVSPIERIFPATWLELASSFTVGRHGVLVTAGASRAAQLPAMWARHTNPESFVTAVAEKAGVASGVLLDDAAWYRFETIDY